MLFQDKVSSIMSPRNLVSVDLKKKEIVQRRIEDIQQGTSKKDIPGTK
jgi:hypothetical protein